MQNYWTEEELEAAVRVYIEMMDLSNRNQAFSKKAYYEELSSQFSRSEKAFEYRMQNISTVFASLGRPWVPGLKPMANVGANVAADIERLIRKVEDERS